MEEQKSFKIDSRDRKIISLLKKDPKISHQRIADKLKVARQTVQKRIKDLEENGIIRYAVLTNEKKLGKEITAFILVEFLRAQEGHTWGDIHQKVISRMDELELLEVHYVSGQEDVLLKMRTTNIDTLRVNLVKITNLEGVSRTRTLISLTSAEKTFPETMDEFLRELELIEQS